MRYAKLEIENHNIDRARSIFERALAVDYSYAPLWLRYSQMEILSKQFAHARAVYERSVTLLPYEQKVWFSYLEMEELLGNLDACRSIFERWTQNGGSVAWKSWYHFEKNNQGNSLEVLDNWTARCPEDLQSWLALSRESDVRGAYSRAIDTDALNPADRTRILRLWADYEHSCGESARSQALLDIAGIAPGSQAYLDHNSTDIEFWWIEISVHSDKLDTNTLSQMYQKAVNLCEPKERSQKTAAWHKYALLWLRYAIYAEKKDLDVSSIYEDALSRWPHEQFTSATLWKAYTDFELRQQNVARARKIYGSALGKTRGNLRIYSDYIELEKKLLATDKVRLLLSKNCEQHPYQAETWIAYANFEISLDEWQRARAIFKSAAHEAKIDDLNTVLVTWAEAEADNGEFERARDIWNQAVVKAVTGVAEVWAQFAMFEISTGLGDEDDQVDEEAIGRGRAVFLKGFKGLRELNSERLKLYDLFIQFEETYGTEETLESLRNKAPKPVSKVDERGVEHIEYEFPEVEESAVSKLLANARKWAAANTS